MALPLSSDSGVDEIEVKLLLDAIHRRYAYDFRGYARASLRRRLVRRATLEGVQTLSGLQERILHDPACFERLLNDLSINVTAMFRDPSFHRALREKAFGVLRTYPFVRVWVAGCSTGEEVYSLAISLHEADLLERSRIYATDIDEPVLARARRGRFPIGSVREYTRNYLAAGGVEDFSAYYSVAKDEVHFDPVLARNIVFAQHNLASDGSFNEFNLILCRNVMIYFGRALQDQVLTLFDDSLARLGLLALGHKETLAGTAIEQRFEPVDAAEKIYRRTS